MDTSYDPNTSSSKCFSGKHTVYCAMSLISCPLPSPLIWSKKHILLEKKIKYNMFYHYKFPLNYFPCFSTAKAPSWKILYPCQDQHKRDMGHFLRWKGKIYNLTERAPSPLVPMLLALMVDFVFFTSLLVGERVGKQLPKALIHFQLCKERKGVGAMAMAWSFYSCFLISPNHSSATKEQTCLHRTIRGWGPQLTVD